MIEATASADALDRPHLAWWILVLGGLTVLGFQSFDASFYAWWVAHANPLPGQIAMRWVFIACIPIHLYEALYVYQTAGKLGMRRSQTAWTLQTLLLGYPSTHLFRRRARAARLQAARS